MTTDLLRSAKTSHEWFLGKARSASGYRKNIVEKQDRSRDNTVIGRMYFFKYDPKHKKTLPIYDKFPLVFPIERYSDGFLGLNLHYLSFDERDWLLGKLFEFRNNDLMNQSTKLKLTYQLLQTTKKLANFSRPCIHRYLFTHVRSKFIEVIPGEWSYAIHLPVAQWEINP